MIHELVRERRFWPFSRPVTGQNSLKHCIPAADYPRRQILPLAKDAILSWFVVVHMSWFMSWIKPLKSIKQMWGWGWGIGAGGGARAQTQISIPNSFHPWPLILTHIHPLNPFTHGPKHSHTPIPTPPSPMAQTQTPTPNPFHLSPPILTHTHPLNPFTHGHKHFHTPTLTPPLPMGTNLHTPTLTPPSPMGLDTDTHPNPFYPWMIII